MIRLYFGQFATERRPILLAYACGLGENPEGGYVFVAPGALDELRRRAADAFTVVESIDDAAVAVYPHNYTPSAEAQAFAREAEAAGKPCLFFRNTDRPEPADLDHGVVFQESIFASRQRPCEQAHPAAIEDLLRGETLSIRPKEARPKVSFRGFPGTGRAKELLRLLVGGREAFLGSYVRRVANEVCQRSKLLDSQIELLEFNRSQLDDRQSLREAYRKSLIESDYVLAMRGAGNWSYRFYETLSAGRIPVFVNTDAALPLADTIPWRRHVVWVELDDLKRLPQKIKAFHDRLSNEEFEQLQRDNRQLWLEQLEPIAFWRTQLPAMSSA